MTEPMMAPEWQVEQWLNTEAPPTLAGLRGRVVLVIAFQMLCLGCVSFGVPQALRARAAFPEETLAVIGLHTVFEHHEAQGRAVALEAFLHENRVAFPVGIDAGARPGQLPATMRRYRMQGTPTTLVVDRGGRLRLSRFGHLEDMQLGALLGGLAGEAPVSG